MRIKKIISSVNKGASLEVKALLDDGTEAYGWVGGEVEVFFDEGHNKIKFFVKRAQSRGKL